MFQYVGYAVASVPTFRAVLSRCWDQLSVNA
jgi:hypothetical protein